MNPPPAPALRTPRLLPLAALVLWLVSLGLPGFLPETSGEPWYGWFILFIGTPMAGLLNGWAVYANYFFLAAVLILLRGKRPWKSVILMVAFAATLPMFEGVIRDEGTQVKLAVVSWGWGVVVWFYAMAIVVVATVLQGRPMPKAVPWALAGGLVAVVAGLGVVHHRQWSIANEEERAAQIAPGIAFSVGEFCGIPVTWPPETPPSADNIVILDIDKRLRSNQPGLPYLVLPPIHNYQEGNIAWTTLRAPSGPDVKLRIPAKPDRTTLRARLTKDGALVQVLAPDGKTVRYEQRLRAIQGPSQMPQQYCPRSGDTDGRPSPPGYALALARVLGQPKDRQPPGPIPAEAARTRCDVGTKDIDGIRDLRSLDGREAELGWVFRERAGFCSERYIALARVGTNPGSPLDRVAPNVILLERSTLRPLAWYGTAANCVPPANCMPAPLSAIKGIRIEEKVATIETTAGEFTAPAIAPWQK